MEMNKFQTPLTEELKKTLPKEVYDNILELYFIKKMVNTLI